MSSEDIFLDNGGGVQPARRQLEPDDGGVERQLEAGETALRCTKRRRLAQSEQDLARAKELPPGPRSAACLLYTSPSPRD
eukprot:9246879-Alexandrium_andersonii.AAC.1